MQNHCNDNIINNYEINIGKATFEITCVIIISVKIAYASMHFKAIMLKVNMS